MLVAVIYKKLSYTGELLKLSIVIFIILSPLCSLAQVKEHVTITIKECGTDIYIENALISLGNQQRYSDKNGIVTLPNMTGNEIVTVSKLGYKVLSNVLQHNNSLIVCLESKSETLDNVAIVDKKLNRYEYLIKLRSENIPNFLANDTTIYYAFNYYTTTLEENRMIDSASGVYKVNFKKGKFPLQLFSFEDAQIIAFEYYKDPNIVDKQEFNNIRYEDMVGMLALYDLMSKENDNPWNRIRDYNENIDLQIDSNKNKLFNCWFRGELTKIIHFDSSRRIQEVEYYKPTLLLRRRFEKTSQNFKIKITYRQQLPRMADTLYQNYEVRSGKVKYNTTLKLYATSEHDIKIKSAREGKFLRDIILNASGTFYNINNSKEKGLKRGYVKEVDDLSD